MKNKDVKDIKIGYTSIDGTPIVGILSIPSKMKGFALMMHGITETKDEWENFYVEMSKELNDNFIGALRFDFRGHGESGGSSMDISIIGDILDVKASLEQIKKYWDGKIVLVATSFGAGPAIMAASQIQDIIHCIVLIAPVISYKETFLEPKTDWARSSFNEKSFEELSEKGYLLLDGSFKLSARLIEEFRFIDPTQVLESLRVPILLIHGEKDSMVPFEVSEKYKNLNSLSKFISLPNADHGFPDADDETGMGPKSQQNKKIIFNEINNFIMARNQ